MEIDKKDQYSWFKVHFYNFVKEFRVLIAGVVKNFRRISWISGKDLFYSYVQVLGVMIFLTVFCFMVFVLSSKI